MNSWISQLHETSRAFPPTITAVKLAVALAIGLLIGFERQWSRKDFGARTFSFIALLGALTALISVPVMLMGMLAAVVLAALLNVHDIVTSRPVEGTTSVILVITFVLGALVGQGHMFTPVACAIVATWLLSLKSLFQSFAGGVRSEEIRSAIMLGLFGFVVWPLMPNRYIDPWNLLQPREVWVTVLVVACIGFINYVLLRIYGKRGIGLTAILGGLVNSTATAAELSTSLPAAGLLSQTAPAVLLTSTAMFARNALLLGIFARGGVKFALLPLLSMMAIAGFYAYRFRERDVDAEHVELHLASPVSLRRVLQFGMLFLVIQVLGTAAVRWLGNSGIQLVSLIGGIVSSASATAAAANLVAHGQVTPMQAGTATVLTSIASTTMNLPIVRRQVKNLSVVRAIFVATALQGIVGILVLLAQQHFLHKY